MGQMSNGFEHTVLDTCWAVDLRRDITDDGIAVFSCGDSQQIGPQIAIGCDEPGQTSSSHCKSLKFSSMPDWMYLRSLAGGTTTAYV